MTLRIVGFVPSFVYIKNVANTKSEQRSCNRNQEIIMKKSLNLFVCVGTIKTRTLTKPHTTDIVGRVHEISQVLGR